MLLEKKNAIYHSIVHLGEKEIISSLLSFVFVFFFLTHYPTISDSSRQNLLVLVKNNLQIYFTIKVKEKALCLGDLNCFPEG